MLHYTLLHCAASCCSILQQSGVIWNNKPEGFNPGISDRTVRIHSRIIGTFQKETLYKMIFPLRCFENFLKGLYRKAFLSHKTRSIFVSVTRLKLDPWGANTFKTNKCFYIFEKWPLMCTVLGYVCAQNITLLTTSVIDFIFWIDDPFNEGCQ